MKYLSHDVLLHINELCELAINADRNLAMHLFFNDDPVANMH